MDEQGLPQVTNAELIAVELGTNDLIAADEGFSFTGQLQATLADAVEHAASIRERLVEIQRKDS